MKDFAGTEAIVQEEAPAHAPETTDASLSANAGLDPVAEAEPPARKSAARAKPATATAPVRRTEREGKPSEEPSGSEAPPETSQVSAEQGTAQLDEAGEGGEADEAPEASDPPFTPAPEAVGRMPHGPAPRTTPRPLAPPETFAEGDYVVYPTHGVGRVEKIATEEIAGHKLELIHITFEENRMTLRVPVAKARTAGLRKLATRHMFDKALDVLRGRARVKRTMWSRRAQEYEAKINSGDPLSIAEVVRDLHRNAGQPDQSFSERQIYESAMDRLAAELAALEKTDKASAATKLAEFLKTVG